MNQYIETPAVLKQFTNFVVVISLIMLLALFLPWQQTITGEGKVTIFSPMERPQVIHSQIEAKITKWHVKEGDMVKAGDPLLELAELNPRYLDLDLSMKLEGQRSALLAKKLAINSLIASLNSQSHAMRDYRSATVPNADLQIKQTTDRFRALQERFVASKQNLITAELNFERRRQLFEQGLSSKRDFELSELALAEARAQLNAAQAELDVAQRSVLMSQNDVLKTSSEADFKIQDIQGKIASSYEKLAEIDSDVYKIDIEIANLTGRVDQRLIKAPCDGQVTQLITLGQTETIKPGDDLAIVVPDSLDQAAEIYISDSLAPLLSPGREVRLQFSGWPALQFIGWPSIAVGSFSGKVTVVDAVSLQEGKVRVIIKPDTERIKTHKDHAWPSSQYLRPGTKVVAWILLDKVPMWFELWRVFSGFQPSLIYNPEQKGKIKIK
jgi:adhesin transport system membrane fusion protein